MLNPVVLLGHVSLFHSFISDPASFSSSSQERVKGEGNEKGEENVEQEYRWEEGGRDVGEGTQCKNIYSCREWEGEMW